MTQYHVFYLPTPLFDDCRGAPHNRQYSRAGETYVGDDLRRDHVWAAGDTQPALQCACRVNTTIRCICRRPELVQWFNCEKACVIEGDGARDYRGG